MRAAGYSQPYEKEFFRKDGSRVPVLIGAEERQKVMVQELNHRVKNTLATARHGALSAPSGRVRVSWRPGGPGRLRLDWEEVGGPLVEPPRRRGFGFVLLQKVLAYELQGEVRLELPPHGARCTMDMALDQISTH